MAYIGIMTRGFGSNPHLTPMGGGLGQNIDRCISSEECVDEVPIQ